MGALGPLTRLFLSGKKIFSSSFPANLPSGDRTGSVSMAIPTSVKEEGLVLPGLGLTSPVGSDLLCPPPLQKAGGCEPGSRAEQRTVPAIHGAFQGPGTSFQVEVSPGQLGDGGLELSSVGDQSSCPFGMPW